MVEGALVKSRVYRTQQFRGNMLIQELWTGDLPDGTIFAVSGNLDEETAQAAFDEYQKQKSAKAQ